MSVRDTFLLNMLTLAITFLNVAMITEKFVETILDNSSMREERFVNVTDCDNDLVTDTMRVVKLLKLIDCINPLTKNVVLAVS